MKTTFENVNEKPVFQPKRLIIDIESQEELLVFGELYNYSGAISGFMSGKITKFSDDGKITKDRVHTALKSFEPVYLQLREEGVYL